MQTNIVKHPFYYLLFFFDLSCPDSHVYEEHSNEYKRKFNLNGIRKELLMFGV